MVRIRCECGKRLKVSADHVGRRASCPDCRRKIHVVAPGSRDGDEAIDGMLIVHAGPNRVGEQIFLGGREPVRVGKGDDVHIRLLCRRVSRSHCQLRRTDYGWRVEDLGSTNGIVVNGRRVKGANLLEGDLVGLGSYTLRFMGKDSLRHTMLPTSQEMTAINPAECDDSMAILAGDAADMTSVDAPAARGSSLDDTRAAPTVSADDNEVGIAGDDYGESRFAAAVARSQRDEPRAASAAPLVAPDEAEDDIPISEPIDPDDEAGSRCPCCGRPLAKSARICVVCGIDVVTGRTLITAHEGDLDATYAAAEGVIRPLSFLIWTGLYPIASEAYGSRRPHAVKLIAVVTVAISLWFLALDWTGSSKMVESKNLMLWSGSMQPEPEAIAAYYNTTSFGNTKAFYRTINDRAERGLPTDTDEAVLAAHTAMPPEQRCLGSYRPSQLITHAFLHGGVIHLMANLLFLLVLGTRVNAAIGNIATVLVYPLLAVGAALAHMASMAGAVLHPMLGASGAVMGLAGMYLILFPVHKVHIAFWLRLSWLFPVYLRLFAIRGFLVVGLYVALDVLFVSLGIEDNTAHWAHIGGFLIGMGLAIVLLVARVARAQGGDVFSLVLGRYAWPLVGRPDRI